MTQVALLAVAAAGGGVRRISNIPHPPWQKEAHYLFESWKERYGVSYANEEEEAERMLVFKQSMDAVEKFEDDSFLDVGASAGPASHPPRHTLGLNRFADMTWCVRAYFCFFPLFSVCLFLRGWVEHTFEHMQVLLFLTPPHRSTYLQGILDRD